MKYKKLGRTGMTVSRICLGTGNWGYSDESYGNWATTGEREAFRIMDAALDAGVNFFDCANVYGNHGAGTTGTSEEIIGKWFRLGGGRREKVIMPNTSVTLTRVTPASYSPRWGQWTTCRNFRFTKGGTETFITWLGA